MAKYVIKDERGNTKGYIEKENSPGRSSYNSAPDFFGWFIGSVFWGTLGYFGGRVVCYFYSQTQQFGASENDYLFFGIAGIFVGVFWASVRWRRAKKFHEKGVFNHSGGFGVVFWAKFFLCIVLIAFVLAGGAWGGLSRSVIQADEVLVNIEFEDMKSNCYFVSLEVIPENNTNKKRVLVKQKKICGDFVGLGYDLIVPAKTFKLIKSPGIIIRSIHAFDQKSQLQKDKIYISSYNIELLESVREYFISFFEGTGLFRSVIYDVKVLRERPQKKSVISFQFYPLRQDVTVDCKGCR